jgi:hypothetical protein
LCFIACYCGGFSARAHQSGDGATPSEARERTEGKWNQRSTAREGPEIEKKQQYKTIILVESNGDEHDYTEDDEVDYWYRYGRDDNDHSTNEHELRIYRNAGPRQVHPVLVAAFFHPRYVKEFWER